MDLLLTRSLLAVADSGSVSEAAQTIGLSQPALSRRIQQLEEELGAELLERSRRGVVLTAMGRLVVREGRVLVERYDRLKATVSEHLHLEAGSVRIGGGATAVSHLLPGAIADFRRGHPGVRFQLKEAGSREIEAGVVDESLDLGLVTLPVHSADLRVQPLYRDRIVLVAGKGHPLAKRKRIGVRALDGQSLIGFEAGSAIRQLIDNALREAGVEMNVVMELRSIAAIMQMVETMGSLAFVSELGARGGTPLAVHGLRLERQLAVISKRGRPTSPGAKAFAEHLQESWSSSAS